jgi:hypothetical protein
MATAFSWICPTAEIGAAGWKIDAAPLKGIVPASEK